MRQSFASLTPERWRWLLLLVFVVAEIAIISVTRFTIAGPDGGDLCRDYIDARRLLAGQDVYAPFTACGNLHHSPHPPLALLILVPLAVLPIGAAALVWDLLMLVALVTALWMIWRELGTHLDPRWLAVGLVILATWSPLQNTWLEAQVGPLSLLLLTLAWRARRHNEPWQAGIWLAVATLLRLYPVLLFAYPLLRREWRVAGGGLAAGLGLTVLTLPFTGLADYVAYITREAPGASAEWINDAHNVSWRGWLGQLFTGSNTIHPVVAAPWLVTPLFVLGVVAVLGFLLWRGWHSRHVPLGSASDDSAWLLAIPAMLFISPLAWPHYFVIMLLPVLVAANYQMQRRRWSRTAILLLVSVLLLDVADIGLQALYPLPRLLPWPAAVFVFALPFYALVCGGVALAQPLCLTVARPNARNVR